MTDETTASPASHCACMIARHEPTIPSFRGAAGRARSLRIAVVTETYPPEVNGVAQTAARFVEGLRARGHEIQLVRPRQGDERIGARCRTRC